MLLICCIFSLVAGSSQWLLLEASASPRYDIDDKARPPFASGEEALWCEQDVRLLLDAQGSLWSHDERRGWLWQPKPPFVLEGYAAHWTLLETHWLYKDDELWSYDAHARVWSAHQLAEGARPGQRRGSAYWSHSGHNRLYLLGGYDGNGTICDDLWVYEVATHTWSQVGRAPASVAYSPVASGRDEDVAYWLNDGQMWRLDMGTHIWESMVSENTGPMRTNHTLWVQGPDLMLFGGNKGSRVYDETWRFSVTDGRWDFVSVGGPSGRFAAASCITTKDGMLHIYGGLPGDNNDLWLWGSQSLQSLLDGLDLRISSATIAALIAAVLSLVSVMFLITFAIIICIQRYRLRKANKSKVPMFSPATIDTTEDNEVGF